MLALQLLREFCTVEQGSKMKPKFPFFMVGNVDTCLLLKSNTTKVKEFCAKNDLEFQSITIESIFKNACNFIDKHIELTLTKTEEQSFKQAFDSLTTLTSKEELLEIYTTQALCTLAKQHNCDAIIFGNNSTNLAVRVLANTAKGKGISLPQDLAISVVKDDIVQVKPLRDILLNEIEIYAKLTQLEFHETFDLTSGMHGNVSINKITKEFVLGLQLEYPSTVSTISKTAFKIENVKGLNYETGQVLKQKGKAMLGNENENTRENVFGDCVVCRGYLELIRPVDFISEFELIEARNVFPENTFKPVSGSNSAGCGNTNVATSVSATASCGTGDCCQTYADNSPECSAGGCSSKAKIEMYSQVCYSCKNILRDMESTNKNPVFPGYVYEQAEKGAMMEKMRKDIQDFLL
jgi:cytoplasmic tRNA 2-thiolation protein 2